MASVLRKDPDRRPVRIETGVIFGAVYRKGKNGKRLDLPDCFWQRDREKRNRKTVSPFCETDPSFSRCIFSGHSDHGMVCGYIGIKENWPYPGRYMSQGLRNRMRSGGGKLQYEKQEKK